MIKGDRIRLLKPMGAFTNVGEVCEVTDVAEGGIISFRFGGVHLGCMSYDEYEKYFERIECDEKPAKRIWTEWEETDIVFYSMQNELKNIIVKYRNNGKKIQVRHDGYKAESTCHAADTFNVLNGLNLAIDRLIVKYLDGQVKEMAKMM